jgi:hypothetical protein
MFSDIEVVILGGWTGTEVLNTVDKLNIETGRNL